MDSVHKIAGFDLITVLATLLRGTLDILKGHDITTVLDSQFHSYGSAFAWDVSDPKGWMDEAPSNSASRFTRKFGVWWTAM